MVTTAPAPGGVRRLTAWVLATLASLVLLLGYHTSTAGSILPTRNGTVALAGPASTSVAPATGSGSSTGSGSGTGGGTGSATYTGAVASTQWGPVQVQITVSGGRITAATAVQAPDQNGRDREINGYAVPVYDQEAVAAQSARIDAVSGATVTWGGYTQSLQSAIDQAGLR